MTEIISAPVRIPGLADGHQELISQHLATIAAKASRNRLRRRYYEHKSGLRDLGIAIPPHLKTIEKAVGLPAKAVDSTVRRTVLDAFTLASGLDPVGLGVDAIFDANRLDALLPQAHTDVLIDSCAFAFVHAGDVAAGEPEAVVTVKSARAATGTWSPRLRALTDALSVISTDRDGSPDHLALYLPNEVIICRRDGRGWDLRRIEHDLGVPVEPLPYRPALDRPFGRSRISRPVMSITDSLVRSLLRTEVGAEFFNAPQRYAMGAEEGAFRGADGSPLTGWQIMLGRMLTLSRDENGDLPTVGQFPQQSMEPNIAEIRMLLQLFAGETSLPLRALGVVGDNPESAEAIAEANKELELDIRAWQDGSLTPGWRRTMVSALRLLDDTPAARAEYAGLRLRWRNPSTVSMTAAGDWLVKVGAAIPGLAESTVGLEMAGLNGEQIARFQAERRRAQADASLAAILSAARGTGGDEG